MPAQSVGLLAVFFIATPLLQESGWARTQKEPATETMAERILFYYINLSAFQGNGDVVWLGEGGSAFVQIAEADKSSVFSFHLPKATFAKIRGELREADSKSLAANERDAVPGEVIVKIGFRNGKGTFTSLRIIDDDWPRQPKELQIFKQIAQRLLDSARNRRPSQVETVKPGALAIPQPKLFLASDVLAAIR